jgi:hypothetical protein
MHSLSLACSVTKDSSIIVTTSGTKRSFKFQPSWNSDGRFVILSSANITKTSASDTALEPCTQIHALPSYTKGVLNG